MQLVLDLGTATELTRGLFYSNVVNEGLAGKLIAPDGLRRYSSMRVEDSIDWRLADVHDE